MKINSAQKPAALGGKPIFENPVSFNCPTLPTFTAVQTEIERVMAGGHLTNGPKVAELETKAADYFGRLAVALASCTSGLILTAKVLGLTGQVIVPSFTFFATSHSLIWNNLEPLFVDIRADSWNIDPEAVEAAVNPRVSAILAVDVFGNPGDKDELQGIARKHGLKLITDAAHSFGATYRNRAVGGFGDAEVFSLSPTKLVVAGEGGLVGVENEAVAEELRIARDYGNEGEYDCRFVGLNARLPEINAVIASAGIEMLADNVAHRQEIAACYGEGLAEIPGLVRQKIDSGNRSTFKDVSWTVDPEEFGIDRNQLAEALAAEGIPTRKYFYPPAHLQSAYKGHVSIAGDLPITGKVSNQIICFPIYSHMPKSMVEKICLAIDRIFQNSDGLRAAATAITS